VRSMSEALQEHRDFLSVLKKSNDKVRRVILENADCKLVNCLCEVAFNTLRGAVPLSKLEKKRLVPHKNTLRILSRKKLAWRKRRKILAKKGGAFIFPIIASLLGGLFGQIIK